MSKNIPWKVRVNDENCLPERAHVTDAGFDLRSRASVTIPSGGVELVPLGFESAIPEGGFGMLVIRSGMARKYGLTLANGVGIIDADYRGEVAALVRNGSARRVEIPAGTRLAQLVLLPLLPVSLVEVTDLADTERGAGGFGSTGHK